jgi:hypothetical protein
MDHSTGYPAPGTWHPRSLMYSRNQNHLGDRYKFLLLTAEFDPSIKRKFHADTNQLMLS